MTLPFEERACFAAGQAKTGTTLLIALLDGHPQLLVLPEETAYFPTALNKYGKQGRRAQFDYLTKEALSRVLFGGPPEWEKMDYGHFPVADFRERFETAAFDPKNAHKDLLVLMMQTYAEMLGIPLDSVVRWLEKTPANRRFIPQILERFPHAKLLIAIRARFWPRKLPWKKREKPASSRFTTAFRTGCRQRSWLYARNERRFPESSPATRIWSRIRPRRCNASATFSKSASIAV
jgi:Sulfotransferase family